MEKIAFYIMNSKGWYVLSQFLEEFDPFNIAYIVSEQDINLKNDPYPQLEKLAKKYDIPFYKRAAFNVEVENKFQGYKFAIGWRWLIKNQHNLIVFHDSLLPKYRGFSPLVNSLINGEKQGGVTALFADVKYDEGEIILQASTQFEYPITIENAIQKIEPLYFDLVLQIYKILGQGKLLTSLPQKHTDASFSLWLDTEDYFIDWSWSAEKIKRFIDSVGFPYDGAKSKLNGTVVIIEKAEVVKDVVVEHRDRHVGKVIFIEESPVIVCTKGLLKLRKISDLGRQAMQINFRSKFC
jgi:methionyl-tRNA formyltransferase